MSETLIIESKNSQKNNFNYFLDNFPISEGLQYTSNPTNINRIFDSLFSPFSLDNDIDISYKDLDTKLHYSYKEAILKKLYEDEKYINITINEDTPQIYESKVNKKAFGYSTFIDNHQSEHKINLSLSSLFYLDLLITEYPNEVNYSYPYELIVNLNQSFKKNNHESHLKVIESKIIIDLITNFKGLKENNEFLYNNYLEVIEKENLKIFDSNSAKLKLGYSSEDNIKIDQIYVDIINSLIKEEDKSNCQYIEGLLTRLKELDLDKIDITQKMIHHFSNILTENNRYLDKYKIESIDDFINVNKINFYYILLKYIFKKSYLIYQIPFLLSTRNSILKSIGKYLNGKSSLIFDSKSKYVLKKILDSNYYSEKILNFTKKETIYPQKIEYNESHELNDNIIDENSDYITIIDKEKEIKGKYLCQNSDDTFLFLNQKTRILHTYNQFFNIESKSNKELNDINCVCELSTISEDKKTQVIICTNKAIILIIKENNKYHEKIRKEMTGCSFFLEISKNLYLISGENGTKFLDGNFKEIKDYENDKLKDKSYRSGIVINQSIIALASRDLNIGGENKLLFYNFISKKIIYEISGYSFIQSPKNLVLFPKDKPRILMCPCEKENGKEKGILFINLDILNKRDSEIKIINNDKTEFSKYIYFYNSENFKIYCICLLQSNITDNSNSKDKIYLQYFFAGGHEENEGRIFGQVNLYQMSYNNSPNFNIIINLDEKIRRVEFEPTISSMMLTKKYQKLLINCEEKSYVYKKPNIKFYLQNSDITT